MTRSPSVTASKCNKFILSFQLCETCTMYRKFFSNEKKLYNPYLPCSAATKVHNITDILTYHTDPVVLMYSTSSAYKTDHSYMPCSVVATTLHAAIHNITHSPCTSICTTHQALPTLLPSTTLLCTQLTNTRCSGKMAQHVGVV